MGRHSHGIFITLEGVHGCGKTTVAQQIQTRIQEMGISCVITGDQSGTAIGREIRRINLLTQHQVAPITETLLFAAAKHQNLVEVVVPNLALGNIVVCERYVDAFYAFQECARGIPRPILDSIHQVATDGIMPDLTILLDMDPLVALARIKDSDKHRIEQEPASYHWKLRQGYLRQAENHPARIRIVDASRSASEVVELVWAEVLRAMGATPGGTVTTGHDPGRSEHMNNPLST